MDVIQLVGGFQDGRTVELEGLPPPAYVVPVLPLDAEVDDDGPELVRYVATGRRNDDGHLLYRVQHGLER